MGQNVRDLLCDKRAILFDMDGTLVNSNDLHASAWVEALETFGYSLPVEQVRRLIGKGGDKLLPELTGLASDDPKAEEISAARARLFTEFYAPRVKAFPKVKELISLLQAQGKKLVLASSASNEELTAILKAAGLESCFSLMTTSDDAAASKPDPDIVRVALQKSGEPADKALMIGDTPYDLEAAARAGITALAFRAGGWSDDELEAAAAVLEGPEELLVELAGPYSALKPERTELPQSEAHA